MNEALLARYDASLRGLARKDRLRTLAPRAGLDFSSNDYLGLAASKRLGDAVAAAIARGTPVGATGSRLLRGNAPEHEALEADAAAFFGAERALFFGSGYIANFALLTALPQKGDLLVLDELAHASMHEGAQAGRAQFVVAKHNDVDAVDEAITRWRAEGGMGRVWIGVESLYSMDGDRAPMESLVALADRHEAFLVVDEAHATGVWGPDGRGLAAAFEGRDNIIALHTCGKALGASGALVAGPRTLCDYLVNRCRPLIYATAPSPLMAVAACEALAMLSDEPLRRVQLRERVAFAGRQLAERCGVMPSGSQIQPFVIGDVRRTMAVAAALQARGYDIRGIRPPTVPEGTSRLRISLTLNVAEADISAMVEALVEVLAQT
ncbi:MULTISPECIES: 8-amino-7-oxononanoate synthase [unclassified Mesorhizobium]|uniref:8-amino-7-oxononanoate synthase n=4 Tax=Mesorhizobium TaxID=68287 RepID=UPI000F751E30|nr:MULTISPECIES: 8-amino-7-oxononanoate synthase [unclassified Mesorhizobium]TGP72528.1 8-amino-7-oxononanoate synthase [bacterium M00.F.Ca.ET.227.01.1.1]TGP83933.1 8-amino-7-oxononanoate synthase [bacterium M00.F.Ca.ET.221.01.1.1]TGP85653.1 8-amino-7-oxononanoate synthase [bacterium M00.F.Ca.ET.222.01.1.1]TGT64522.1 8-amino-7-oxononanoate synthase [bacterium M00.F.Ca.ET.159.01.1.1]TGT79372.1 8-amino-7-oxononanoate synthase [bacterium M00.F.Ca.ET.157.01.1.1]TGU02623.1 8-amino-7-oxononanoate s